MQFTDKSIKSYKDPQGRLDYSVWDDGLPGFGFRVQKGKAKIYYAKYSFGGKPQWLRIGPVDNYDRVDDARKKARAFFQSLDNDINPATLKDTAKAGAKQTFNPTYEAFLLKMAGDVKTGNCAKTYYDATAAYFAKHLKKLHGHPLATLDKETVGRVLDVITDERGPIASNRARSAGAAFYNWAIRKFNGIDKNPFEMTEKNLESSRDRVMHSREIKSIWHKLADDDYGHIMKLLILTGCRRNEIGGLRWREVNLDDKQLEIPGTYTDEYGIEQRRTKNGLPLILPLSSLAFKILSGLNKSMIGHNSGGGFVFGRYDGPFSGWSKAKKELDAKLKLDEWTLHDFRRTLATDAGEFCGVAPHIVEAILNHVSGKTKGGVAGVYNKAQYLDEKRDALNKYGARIAGIVN